MSFLSEIIAKKHEEIPCIRADAQIRKLKKSFIQALRMRCPSLIAEIKPRSPSRGTLIEPADIPVLLQEYNAHADAISVLCDNGFFGGGYDLLSDVRLQTELPILAKEFIVHTSQIDAANQAGADAILLIAAMLSREELRDLALYAEERGMAVLLEIHAEEEIERIPSLSADAMMLGINNRNLMTLEIDLATTPKLAKPLREKFPKHILIAESGTTTSEHVRKLTPIVDGFLIGTGLLNTESRAEILRHFPM